MNAPTATRFELIGTGGYRLVAASSLTNRVTI